VRLDAQALPLAEGAADEIRAVHVIEHLSRTEWRHAKADWYRVLRPGGRLEIRCPALDVCMNAYLAGEPDRYGIVDWWTQTLYGGQRHAGDFHRNGFTAASLCHDLAEEGLHIVCCEILDGWNLHVQAIKPPDNIT
jgi:SAM-dependent methyltransferase